MNDHATAQPGDSSDEPTVLGPSSGYGHGERAGDEIGQYRLLSVLGEGGFGTVWLAERREPFVQRVALKVIKPGMDSRSVLGRFEQERQALAMMNHPNIARVLDGGLTAAGRPYFVMEYVKGQPITAFSDARRLDIRQRLELFTKVCEAMQHAHLKGIIHRDLKPSNVLAFDAESQQPTVKVIDFGVAKAMQPSAAAHTVFTETGQMIGTPEYMSPEQADSRSADVDTRSDIYSLGVLLYELLAGVTPFDARELRSRAYRDVQRYIAETDPPAPSTRLSTIADVELRSRIVQARGQSAESLMHSLRRELEWIPLMAMRKEPQNRYQSATDLARDVRNYLDGRALVAAPESAMYRTRKFMRRHRVGVMSSITVAVAILTGLGVALWQWRQAVSARDLAEQKAAEATAMKDLIVRSLTSADPMQGGNRSFTVHQAMQQAVQRLREGSLKDQPEAEIALKMTIAQILQEQGDLETAITLETESLRSLEAIRGPQHPDVPVILNNLATLEQNRARLPEAEALLRRAIDVGSRGRSDEDPDMLVWRRNLAGVLQDQGRLDEAGEIYTRVLETRERTLGPNHASVAMAANALGTLRRDQGRPADAEPLFRRSLAINRANRDPKHPSIGIDLANLGLVLTQQRKLEEADACLNEAVRILTDSLGVKHARTRRALQMLAELRHAQGRDSEADALRARAADGN